MARSKGGLLPPRKRKIRLGWTCCNTCGTTHSNKLTARLHWAWLQCVEAVRLLITPAGREFLTADAVACVGCAEPLRLVTNGQDMAVCSVCESVFLSKRAAEGMVKARKPHIRVDRRRVFPWRSWQCYSNDRGAGYGLTPAAAYGAWLALRDEPWPKSKDSKRVKIYFGPPEQPKQEPV